MEYMSYGAVSTRTLVFQWGRGVVRHVIRILSTHTRILGLHEQIFSLHNALVDGTFDTCTDEFLIVMLGLTSGVDTSETVLDCSIHLDRW